MLLSLKRICNTMLFSAFWQWHRVGKWMQIQRQAEVQWLLQRQMVQHNHYKEEAQEKITVLTQQSTQAHSEITQLQSQNQTAQDTIDSMQKLMQALFAEVTSLKQQQQDQGQLQTQLQVQLQTQLEDQQSSGGGEAKRHATFVVANKPSSDSKR